jgi:hypothetical protein
MFIWTLQDVLAVVAFSGLAVFLVGLVAFEYGGRQLSRPVPIRSGQRWVDWRGKDYVIDDVTDGMVRHTNEDGMHTFRGANTIEGFRNRRMRYAGRKKPA